MEKKDKYIGMRVTNTFKKQVNHKARKLKKTESQILMKALCKELQIDYIEEQINY